MFRESLSGLEKYWNENNRFCISLMCALTATVLIFALSSSTLFAADEAAPDEAAPAQQQGTTYYVSKSGNNQGGHSWQTAWNEMDKIDWNQIDPGDTIVVDGGNNGMTYSKSLQIRRSGSYGKPIRIVASTESGHDGKVTLFGGRTQKLPYCGQSSFYDESGLEWFGIKTNDHSWIEIDGRQWRGITVHGFERSGVRVDRHSKNITVRNVEIYNNGYAQSTSNGWNPEGVGLRLGGENVLLERAIIRDNGQDAIQSLWHDNNLGNFRMNYSWLHNSRRHPSVNEAFNYCTHTDGIQIYDGGVIKDITIENSIVGPGFTQPLIMGQSKASNGAWADVQNVVIRDTIITKATDNAVYGYRNSNSKNWHLERVTLDCASTKGQCLYLMNRDHSVQDSVIYKGRVIFPNGMINQYANNCTYQNKEFQLGKNADPQFSQISDSDRFSLDNYEIASSSECYGLGSRITSVEHLLGTAANQPPSSPNPNPTPTPGSTAVPAPTPTPSPTSLPPIHGSGSGSCSGMVQEAEHGALTGNFQVLTSGSASGGQYIVANNGNRGSRPDEAEKASYCFVVPSSGDYYIQGWVYAPSKYDNSFYVKVDGSSSNGTIWHTQINVGYNAEYVTKNDGYTALKVYLSAGNHDVDIYLREDGTRLDKIGLIPAENAATANRASVNAASAGLANSDAAANQPFAQWMSGSIDADLHLNGTQQDGMPLLVEAGLALVDSATNGQKVYVALNPDATGHYYVDALPTGRYTLKLPKGYGFTNASTPEIEISPVGFLQQGFEFTFTTQQLFLPLIQ